MSERGAGRHAFGRTDTSAIAQWWWTIDHVLLGAATALVVLGVLLQFGTSPAAAARLGLASPFHFGIRQCLFAAGGFALMIGASMLSGRGVRRVALGLWIVAIVAMATLPTMGHAAKGATRWVDVSGFTLQPSEFAKPALAVLVAWMFAEARKGGGAPGLSIGIALWAITVGLLLAEPDIGQTVLITVAFCAACWMAGAPFSWMVGLGGSAVVGLASTYWLFPHVSHRVNGFLGHDHSETDQVRHALEAIAAGGAFGRGPGEGIMKRSVPDLHTDFAYSAAAEEYGLWLSLILIALFALITGRGLIKAMRLSDPYEQVGAATLFVLVGTQAFINVAVNLDLIPTKGMTLPFISYGGSSILAMGLTIGLALALTRQRPGAYLAADHLARAGVFA